jgi:ABC-type amino acid transport substrate-binding protein
MLIAIGCGKKETEVPSAAERMKKNKKVIIVTDPRNPPFEFGKDTGVQGLDVDLGNEIGKTLNIEVSWVPMKGYDHLFELLGKGEAEILISAIAVDPKRTSEFAFSHPYYESSDVIAHQRNVFDIKDLASLSGKTVGVAEGRPGDTFLSTQKAVPNISVKKYPTLDDSLGALNRTEINAVVGDEIMLSYSSFNSFSATTTLPAQVNKYQYAVVVRKNETELLAKVNETIDRLKSSGELQKMIDTWIDGIVEKSRTRGKEDKAVDDRKKAPKVISVNITKVSGAWKMDSLDGFQLALVGPNGKYQSTPILTEGNRGNCKFATSVPPGEYSLSMPISRTPSKVPVPDLPKTSLLMDMSISGGTITITFK